MGARWITADVFEGLASLPDNSVDLVCSSPPFLALRSYLPSDHPDKHLEIGSEATPADFLDTLLDVVEACDRVLAPHGSLVFELGDTFAGSGGAGGDYNEGGLRDGQNAFEGSALRTRRSPAGGGNGARFTVDGKGGNGWPLDKSLCGIPTLFAWSLAYGRNLLRPERTTPPWRIRNVVAWCRPNPPVGALGDKFRPATSYLTVACKARDRYFDLDSVRSGEQSKPGGSTNWHPNDGRDARGYDELGGQPNTGSHPAGAPPLDYWVIPTHPYKGSHYATWPPALCVPVIKSMCPLRVCRVCGEPSRRIVEATEEYLAVRSGRGGVLGDVKLRRGNDTHLPTDLRSNGRGGPTAQYDTIGWTDCGHDNYRPGVVLDCFGGSGTTGMVATGQGRDAILIDLDPRNYDLARERIGMFLSPPEYVGDQRAS